MQRLQAVLTMGERGKVKGDPIPCSLWVSQGDLPPWILILLSTMYWAPGARQNGFSPHRPVLVGWEVEEGAAAVQRLMVFWGTRWILMGDHNPGRDTVHTVTESLSDCAGGSSVAGAQAAGL